MYRKSKQRLSEKLVIGDFAVEITSICGIITRGQNLTIVFSPEQKDGFVIVAINNIRTENVSN